MRAARVCMYIILLLVCAVLCVMLVLDVLALRSFEKRFVDASLGDAPLRRAFVNGAPVECSSAQFPNYVTATRARALEAAPSLLQ